MLPIAEILYREGDAVDIAAPLLTFVGEKESVLASEISGVYQPEVFIRP
jgi:hypothetical protein